jgi:hypothetical protein
MKKILLSFFIIAFAYSIQAQVIVAGVSPSNIVGNYANSWADPASGWGTPDFLIPGTYIQDTLMIANDGSEGLNAQGNPLSAAACSPVINDLSGKIAVIYRGDGGASIPLNGACEFGLKALNAQEAGAIGVIIINREPGVVQMGLGASGATVTIPVVMLSNTDGAILVQAMANGPVEVFIGNKTGLFANDVRLSSGAALAPKQGFVPALLAQNATEFNFSVGARIYNDGSLLQGNVSLRATVTNPSGNTVYDNSVSGLSILSVDSTDVDPTSNFSLPDFSLATYPVGTYKLTYTASMMDTSMTNIVDEYTSDNSISYTFTISESIYSAAKIDTLTGLPSGKQFYRPSTNNQTFSICSAINNPNASRLAVEGLYFAATKGTVVPEDSLMEGEEMNLTLYKWEDEFLDINDANFGFVGLTELAQAYFYYTDESQEAETVYGAFTSPIVLADNQRYLACVQTVNINLYMGHDNTNYAWNSDYYLQPICPNESDGAWYTTGFGADLPSAVGIKVISSVGVGISELNTVDGIAYPNPTSDDLTISIEGEGLANVTVTDISGRIAATSVISLVNGKADFNISNLEVGMYIFNVVLENGKTSQFNVVKK